MPAEHPYPAPFDTATFLFPAEWHAFSDLLGGADTGLLCLREGVIIHVNTHLAEQLGFDDAELIGQPAEFLFPRNNGTSIDGWHKPADDNSHILLRSKTGRPVRFRFIANRIDSLNDASCTIWVLRPEQPAFLADAEPARMQAVVEQLPELVVLCDAGAIVIFSNAAFNAMVGEHDGVLLNLVHPEDQPKLLAALTQAAGASTSTPVAFRIRYHEGSWRQVHGQARAFPSTEAADSVLLSARDVTQELQQQQNIEAEKKRQLHYFNRLFRLAQRPHANLDSALKVILKSAAKAIAAHRCGLWDVTADPAATRCLMAYDDVRQNFIEDVPDGLLMQHLHPLLRQIAESERHLVVSDVDQDPRAALYCDYFHAESIKAWMAVPVQRDGESPALLLFSVLEQPRAWRKDEADFGCNVAGLASLIFRQVKRGKEEAQLRHLAHHDSLTGLPNRHFLFDQTADFFPKLTAGASAVAAFFIDLDGFKTVNDSLGHAVGDELLKAAALRLKNIVRKEDILVRLGGDEFVLLARNLNDMRIADDIAQQIVDTLRGPFSLQGRELQISASVGIAIYPFDGTDIDTLMKKADMAMYQAKSAGRDQYQLFAPALGERMAKRSTLETELRQAIDEASGKLQAGMAVLASVGSSAPFVGLFGTVWGIYHALVSIGTAGQASIDKVAGPVGEALIMTALGLAVAIPATFGYNALVRGNKAIIAKLNKFGFDLHALFVTGARTELSGGESANGAKLVAIGSK